MLGGRLEGKNRLLDYAVCTGHAMRGMKTAALACAEVCGPLQPLRGVGRLHRTCCLRNHMQKKVKMVRIYMCPEPTIPLHVSGLEPCVAVHSSQFALERECGPRCGGQS
jgi:hypothetical protein